jgi:hypothetical protein
MKDYKSINVRPQTHTRLRKAGISGESMDIIINRLLDCDDKRNEK